MKWIGLALVVVLLGLQSSLWLGGGSLRSAWQLFGAIEQQRLENETLASRNRVLAAEVFDLKEGNAAIEELARSELGMIRKDETFHQVAEPRH